MKRALLFVLVIMGLSQAGKAQFSRYIIQFKNKGFNPYSLSNPQQFLSQRAIDRRTRYNIPYDSTDLPVTPRYIDSLRSVPNVTVLNASRWLNSVTIQTTDANALSKINSFSFVVSAKPIALRVDPSNTQPVKVKTLSSSLKSTGTQNSDLEKNKVSYSTTANYYNYGYSYNQVHIHNGEFLHNIGLRGQNMIIGMLDGGYYNYTNLRAFDSVKLNGQVLGTWDFVMREPSVVEDAEHGTNCFSIIAANIPGTFVGTAPKASFYLFKTEDVSSEYPIEEHNWVVGAERVDSAGGDLISCSLGYSTFDNPVFDHTYADMNGNTTISAIGGDIAAKKGLLVVNAAGNEGESTWKYISSPADGDSVLAVAAVDTLGNVASFSSYGPSSDGQVKPDVASVGYRTIIQGGSGNLMAGNGTSFACPNIAGVTTCLWQGFQEFNNMKIIDALRRSGNLASAPNDRIGYGIPNAKKAVLYLLKDFATSNGSISNCITNLSWTSKDVSSMKYEIERKGPNDLNYTKVGVENGSGSVFYKHSYNYTDNVTSLPTGQVSYRIRQIIDTSASGFMADYIDTVTVNFTTACIANNPAAGDFVLFPNPARNEVFVNINTTNSTSNLTIVITDGIGRKVYSERKNKPSGLQIFTIPTYYLAKGKYYITVFDGDKKIGTKEVIKL
jgi:hypothetical protein